MGRQLLSIYPLFSDTIHRCDRILRLNGFPGCLDIIQSEEATSPDPKDLVQLQAFQSAIFALEVALSQLLMSWNILPQAVIGHRYDEFSFSSNYVGSFIFLADVIILVLENMRL